MIVQRTFPSYEDYVYKQGRKARGHADFLLRHLDKKTGWFAKLFSGARTHLRPGAILCLGARTGAENLGADLAGFKGSAGIDLHPIGHGVFQGDWHALQFADHSFPNVYTNSLDHCLDLDKLCAEVRRVLEPHGRFYVMATNRSQSLETWLAKGKNEALYWPTSDDLAAAICERGFDLKKAWKHGKWGHYIFGVQ